MASLDVPPPGDGQSESDRARESVWNERAAFRLAIESRDMGAGRLTWRTRAYHEERDSSMVWTGLPDDAFIEWLRGQLHQSLGFALVSPDEAPARIVKPEPPAQEEAARVDDLEQISGIGPAIARRLYAAGVKTFAALAGSSVEDLASWTGRSVEQIARMEWIERARKLAGAEEPLQAPGEPAREDGPREEHEATRIVFAAVLLNEDGDVVDTMLLDVDEELPIDWQGGRVAQFFTEVASDRERREGAPRSLALDDSQVETVKVAGSHDTYRLRATAHVCVERLDLAQVVKEGTTCRAFLLGYRLDNGQTSVLNAVNVRFEPGEMEAPLVIDAALPDVGRYQLIVAALLTDNGAVSAVSGPVLRVTPGR
ncbi:MAG: hypothetical protein HXY39_06410 [Chloroflexi bacterium]|nr:hypothetical protein [Chloroflexota bacterium]